MEDSAVGLTDESEADLYAELSALTTNSLDMDTDDTGYDETRHSPNIWIEDSLIHNTELDNFIQAAIELAPNDSPMNKMKQLSQWFQEGCVGETKMPPGIKGSVYLDNIVIYSKDPTGRSLTYMEDIIPHYMKTEDSSRWYLKVWQELMEPRNNKKLNPNLCSPDK